MKAIGAVVALALGAAGAQAGGFVDGNELHAECKAATSAVGQSYCMGYVAGVVDSLALQVGEFVSAALLTEIGNSGYILLVPGGIPVCLPTTVKVAQLTDAVRKYLANNPDKRHHPAAPIAMFALPGAFPCPDEIQKKLGVETEP